MTTEIDENTQASLRSGAERFEISLKALDPRLDRFPPRLAEAVRYSLHAGGKRLRPVLVRWCCELCGGDPAASVAPALAIECIHTFSLIHDDLPALYDDDFRRGRPTNHRRFGEALAILAGDALMAIAFEILSDDVADARHAAAMMKELAAATGGAGMIGGEAMDLEGESHPSDRDEVAKIHAAKTARLIQSACRLGAIAARADDERLGALSAYGHALGLAFQAADDLLDVTGSLDTTGKQTDKDHLAGKQTYPRAVGLDESRRIAGEHVAKAVEALAPFGAEANRLASVARYVVERTS